MKFEDRPDVRAVFAKLQSGPAFTLAGACKAFGLRFTRNLNLAEGLCILATILLLACAHIVRADN